MFLSHDQTTCMVRSTTPTAAVTLQTERQVCERVMRCFGRTHHTLGFICDNNTLHPVAQLHRDPSSKNKGAVLHGLLTAEPRTTLCFCQQTDAPTFMHTHQARCDIPARILSFQSVQLRMLLQTCLRRPC
jgi:hypothetical protein